MDRFSPLHAGRAAALSCALLAGCSSAAFAAPFDIKTKVTQAQTLNAGETGIVESAGQLVVTGSRAVTLTGTNVTLTNSGLIQDTGNGNRAIDMPASTGNGNYNVTVTNNAGATITSQGDAFRLNVDTGTGTILVNNSGTISSTGTTSSTNGQAIDFNAITSGLGQITINNAATGIIEAADADAIRPGTNTTINNYGQIIGNTVNGDTGNDGIDFQATGTGTVNNYAGGSITGARHGITGELPITVYNAGNITGSNGSGINMDTQSNTTMAVTNYGTITGNAVSQDGDGIDIDGLATINNYGTIRTFGTVTGEINEGLALGGGTINNYSTGVINSVQRGITIDDSNLGNAFGPTAIYNEGLIEGQDGEAISITSTFADSLTNKGTIIGSIAMGAGDDTINLYTGSTTGSLDGGAGNDALHLYGTGTGTLANVANVETLDVHSGTWTINGSQSYSGGITVTAGATAIVNGALSGDVTNNGTVAVHNGSASFTGTFTNNGAYVSDPASQSFDNLVVNHDGYIRAGSGDTYEVAGNLLATSTRNTSWDTSGATLEFSGTPGTAHDFLLDGKNEGHVTGTNDFSWAELEIDAGNSVALGNGGGSGRSALYLQDLIGTLISGDTVTNIDGFSGAIIYYDPNLAANSYLDGQNYLLEDGGTLVANVPEPGTVAMFLMALLGLGTLGLRNRPI